MKTGFSYNIRFQYYETDNLYRRMYAYENDVLYGFSIPAFLIKGFRYYTIINYDVSKKLFLWLRIVRTTYLNQQTVGSGLDEIPADTRTECRV